MSISCFLSECVDSDERCAAWARAGECRANPNWMPQNCRKSCGTCPPQGNHSHLYGMRAVFSVNTG